MTRRWTIGLLLIAFGLAYLLPMATHGLWIPDESRYAQISQEMLLTGNWISPHFMGLRYFEKPSAGYWLIALGQAIFGENLFGVRVASAFATGLSVVLTYLIATRMWNDSRKGLICALLFMSFGLIAGQAGYSNLDPQFTLWVNLSVIAVWLAVNSVGKQRVAYWVLLGFACAMGVMTKGFLALVLPVLVAAPYMLWQKRLRELFTFGPLAIVVAVLVCLPWSLAINHQEPDFWEFFFWHEHIRRFAGEDAQHSQPWWFYLPLLVAGCAPWVALMPSAFKHAWQTKGQAVTGFLLLWLILPLAFFSLSKGKLPTYIMPCLLPMALLIGHVVMERLDRSQTRVLRVNATLNLVFGVIGLAALLYFQRKQAIYDNEPDHLALAIIALSGWIIANAVQLLRPIALWFMPAIGLWMVIALVPAALPNSVVFNKMPDQFIADHAQELRQARHLLSNDLGAASALAWRVQKTDIALYNTIGEVKYGLDFPDVKGRQIDLLDVEQWMVNARREGSVGVVMRVKSDDELHEIDMLPKDYTRYEQGNIVILIFAQTPP